ncbi:MAG: cob(I)yrinic acid a,c-diamide adenosyltransferase [Clostridiales Family XIII bacterium]|jgi:cob(I)alamin adenosyltransferase|nr:cob(I)yrinic acid a,c-diamide adenosyltransferase [Clostridiales Family XIII bacterium]
MLENAYVQVYTGNGKGKTTAALGLALRALCAGNRVYFGQFMKGKSYSELKAAEYFDKLTIEQFGDVDFVYDKPSDGDIGRARAGLHRMEEVLASGDYDVVVFDELNTAMFFKMISVDEALAVLAKRGARTEVVITGRYAPKEILELADLITEMTEIKHYYNEGVEARVGIES